MPARLILLGEHPTEYELPPQSTLGRHPDNTVQVLDRIVSKEHASISLEGAHNYRLHDAGSLNGTYVNGKRVTECILQDGDTVSMGNTSFRFKQEVQSLDETSPRPSRARRRAPRGNLETNDAPDAQQKLRNVTIMPGQVQSEIQTRVSAAPRFLPVAEIEDVDVLRADYEKLRIAHELSRSLAFHSNLDDLLQQIVDEALKLIAADRAVILLCDEENNLVPRFVRQQRESEEIRLSTSILDEVRRNRRAVLSSDASMDERFKRSRSIIMQGIRSTMCVPLLGNEELIGAFHVDSTLNLGAFTEKDLQIFTGIAGQAAAAIENYRLAKKIEKEAETRAQFQRLVSPNLVDQIISGELQLEQGGQLREATMLFADIRGFTAMSELHSPEAMVRTLNAYFEEMVDALFAHGGTLDKYVGDEIIGLFGAPVALPDGPDRAIRCALEMLERLARFNKKRHLQGEVPIEIGIGLNTGKVVAGAIGSPQSLQYTVIGDAVNTAARLCSAARAGEILISENTHRACSSAFEVERREPIRVKGKSAELNIYSVVAAGTLASKVG